MVYSTLGEKERWVVNCNPLTVASIKVLAAAANQSMGYTLDQAVEYFSKKVQFTTDKPLHWTLPDDF